MTTPMRLLSTILANLGGGFLLAGCLLLPVSLLTIGINDGEWSHLSKTGSFSRPDLLTWESWQPNNGSITPFRGYQPDRPKPAIPEFRRGRARGFLFDFTVYEGRAGTRDGSVVIPAIGPGWGASYHRIWAGLAFAIGAALLVASWFVRCSKKDDN
jgi:hypothetical protein